jgi:RNA polymerase sigma factor (sigma-70 family)
VTGVHVVPNLESRIAELAAGLEIVALRRLGNRDDARDAAQETIARLLARVRSGRLTCEGELAPIAWGIARHVITDMLRERGRGEVGLTDVSADAPGPLDRLATEEDIRLVRSALSQLQPADRSLLHRCFVDGEKIGKIASALGEPAERLRKRKSRALQRLAAALGLKPGHERYDDSMGDM